MVFSLNWVVHSLFVSIHYSCVHRNDYASAVRYFLRVCSSSSLRSPSCQCFNLELDEEQKLIPWFRIDARHTVVAATMAGTDIGKGLPILGSSSNSTARKGPSTATRSLDARICCVGNNGDSHLDGQSEECYVPDSTKCNNKDRDREPVVASSCAQSTSSSVRLKPLRPGLVADWRFIELIYLSLLFKYILNLNSGP